MQSKHVDVLKATKTLGQRTGKCHISTLKKFVSAERDRQTKSTAAVHAHLDRFVSFGQVRLPRPLKCRWQRFKHAKSESASKQENENEKDNHCITHALMPSQSRRIAQTGPKWGRVSKQRLCTSDQPGCPLKQQKNLSTEPTSVHAVLRSDPTSCFAFYGLTRCRVLDLRRRGPSLRPLLHVFAPCPVFGACWLFLHTGNDCP